LKFKFIDLRIKGNVHRELTIYLPKTRSGTKSD